MSDTTFWKPGSARDPTSFALDMMWTTGTGRDQITPHASQFRLDTMRTSISGTRRERKVFPPTTKPSSDALNGY